MRYHQLRCAIMSTYLYTASHIVAKVVFDNVKIGCGKTWGNLK
jgi:hypothetical protein